MGKVVLGGEIITPMGYADKLTLYCSIALNRSCMTVSVT